jgi:hypothetical protein
MLHGVILGGVCTGRHGCGEFARQRRRDFHEEATARESLRGHHGGTPLPRKWSTGVTAVWTYCQGDVSLTRIEEG